MTQVCRIMSFPRRRESRVWHRCGVVDRTLLEWYNDRQIIENIDEIYVYYAINTKKHCFVGSNGGCFCWVVFAVVSF